jgi:4-carboxymuconolactone decarboxylase
MAPAGRPVSDGGVTAALHGLDPRTASLARVAALVALRSPAGCYRRAVADALEAGATADDVVDTLCSVAPEVGMARVVSAAPGMALAVGYDIDAALETVDAPPGAGGPG